ncbi:WD40 repeat-like protein [Pisolithus orientalis]|uniref:WD40 repeat-like protein n=1 Tax=Pisolithus orientalis TaxID=936130 RepID=UPI0022242E97|nr:WD40 repeat-like protein [Pisolithus orientalis]KAI6028605.1 WD40 repeat-like protein [Pisolithus orientalis]
MNHQQRPSLVLAPSVNTTTVVTTTTTTTTYAPIPLPALPPPAEPKNPKAYPLLHANLPPSLRKFTLVFPGGSRATFHDGENGEEEMQEEEPVASGVGWKMLKQDESGETGRVVGLAEAVERFGRKRSHAAESMMEGVEPTSERDIHTPPRKKARATHVPPISTINAAAPPSPLPSPHGSPPPQQIWPSAPPSGLSSPQSQPPLQPDLSLTTLLTLPSLLTHFTNLPQPLQAHFLLTLIRHSPLPVLRVLHSVLTPTLARDFLTLLPPELVSHILSYLPYSTLARASRVSKAWRAIIDSDPVLWRDLMKNTKTWFGGDSEQAFARSVYARRKLEIPKMALPLPHPYKLLFKSRHLTRKRWVTNENPKHLSFPAHGTSVVTCLILSHGRIISASDDHSIHVYSPETGELLQSLEGHEGGVWALAASRDILVSGSTDRTVRIWNLNTGRCTHVFAGHTSTVRWEGGVVTRQKWPKRSLIVTGSRDHSLRVWTLPRKGEPEYRWSGADDGDAELTEEDVEENPYHKLHLEGHDHAVRALAARGRTLVSGSYDCTVRVWDIFTGECKWVLVGHTQKVYSVVLDLHRNIACSGSMDSTVRVWNLGNGQCQQTLTGHTSLVGLLGLSPSYLLRHTLAAHTGAITCFQHDEFKVLSGSDGTLKMWNIREGTVAKDLLTGVNGVWQVVFEGRCCVAASNRNNATMLDVWDFGTDEDDHWVGEPPGGIYDDETDEEDEAEEQADVDAMDQDLQVDPSEGSAEPEGMQEGSRSFGVVDDIDRFRGPSDTEDEPMDRVDGAEGSKSGSSSSTRAGTHQLRNRTMPTGSLLRRSNLPLMDGIPTRLPTQETPTRPRVRPTTRNGGRR